MVKTIHGQKLRFSPIKNNSSLIKGKNNKDKSINENKDEDAGSIIDLELREDEDLEMNS